MKIKIYKKVSQKLAKLKFSQNFRIKFNKIYKKIDT